MTRSEEIDEILTGEVRLDPRRSAVIMDEIRLDIGDRYEVGTFLGAGAYASVWSARDRFTGETVAIKRFDRRDQAPGGFYRELVTLFRLQHERIVRIINLMEPISGFRYLVLEHCAGGSLRPVLSKAARAGRTCDPSRAAELIGQVCEGLQEAHRLGLVHRDIKPENVLLTAPSDQLFGGTVPIKLADFGLARLGRPFENVGGRLPSISGSPAYMAPEQFLGRFDSASDLYSVGVLLYEFLHGRLPFDGFGNELARAHLYDTPKLREDLPLGWRVLLKQMLTKTPEDRPTAEAVRSRLRELGKPSSLQPAIVAIAPKITQAVHCLGVGAIGLHVRAGEQGPEAVAVTPDGLYRFRADRPDVLHMTPMRRIRSSAATEDGSLWLGTIAALHLLPSGSARPMHWLETTIVPHLLAASAEQLALSDGSQVHLIERATKEVTTLQERFTAVRALGFFPSGSLAVADAEALHLFHSSGVLRGTWQMPGQITALGPWLDEEDGLRIGWETAAGDRSSGSFSPDRPVRPLPNGMAARTHGRTYWLQDDGSIGRRVNGSFELLTAFERPRNLTRFAAREGLYAALGEVGSTAWVHLLFVPDAMDAEIDKGRKTV